MTRFCKENANGSLNMSASVASVEKMCSLRLDDPQLFFFGQDNDRLSCSSQSFWGFGEGDSTTDREVNQFLFQKTF